MAEISMTLGLAGNGTAQDSPDGDFLHVLPGDFFGDSTDRVIKNDQTRVVSCCINYCFIYIIS